MAQERDVKNLDKSNTPTDDLKIREFKAKAARLLTRELVVDRLKVELPADVHGEWIRNDSVALAEAKALGFEVDTQYAKGKALHSDSSGAPIVGDAVFMTMPKWQKEVIDDLKKQQYDKLHGIRGKAPEEANFLSQLPKDLKAIDESKTTNASLSTLTT